MRWFYRTRYSIEHISWKAKQYTEYSASLIEFYKRCTVFSVLFGFSWNVFCRITCSVEIQCISYRSLYICQIENYWKLLKITGNYSNYISYGVATILRSSKIHVSFAKEPYERDLYSTKRPSIFKEPTHRCHAVLCIRQNTCNRMYSTLYSILYSIFCMCLPTVATPYYAFCKI